MGTEIGLFWLAMLLIYFGVGLIAVGKSARRRTVEDREAPQNGVELEIPTRETHAQLPAEASVPEIQEPLPVSPPAGVSINAPPAGVKIPDELAPAEGAATEVANIS